MLSELCGQHVADAESELRQVSVRVLPVISANSISLIFLAKTDKYRHTEVSAPFHLRVRDLSAPSLVGSDSSATKNHCALGT